jgi:hypothetical protein
VGGIVYCRAKSDICLPLNCEACSKVTDGLQGVTAHIFPLAVELEAAMGANKIHHGRGARLNSSSQRCRLRTKRRSKYSTFTPFECVLRSQDTFQIVYIVYSSGLEAMAWFFSSLFSAAGSCARKLIYSPRGEEKPRCTHSQKQRKTYIAKERPIKAKQTCVAKEQPSRNHGHSILTHASSEGCP